jgi:hypothetical protein
LQIERSSCNILLGYRATILSVIMSTRDNKQLSDEEWKRAVFEAYTKIHSSPSSEDRWHVHSTATLLRVITKELRTLVSPMILEAGCGAVRYVEAVKHPVLLDYSYTALVGTPRAVVGSVECLPFASEVFGVVICVGSVLNLVDPEPTLRELIRVASPSALLILEYERSESYMTRSTAEFGRDVSVSVCEYQGVQHPLRLYSDKFVDDMLRTAGGVVVRRMYFHVFSAAMLRWCGNAQVASFANWIEFLPLPSFFRRRAANAIIVVRKTC